jgi:hypothetical protein
VTRCGSARTVLIGRRTAEKVNPNRPHLPNPHSPVTLVPPFSRQTHDPRTNFFAFAQLPHLARLTKNQNHKPASSKSKFREFGITQNSCNSFFRNALRPNRRIFLSKPATRSAILALVRENVHMNIYIIMYLFGNCQLACPPSYSVRSARRLREMKQAFSEYQQVGPACRAGLERSRNAKPCPSVLPTHQTNMEILQTSAEKAAPSP